MRTQLHRYTFKNKRIRNWVEETAEGRALNLFAGKTQLSIEEVRNDLDETMNAEHHLDALEFAVQWDGEKFDTVLLDPPYSYRKSMEMYNGKITSPFNALKDALVPILNNEGIVITFGYHSVSMGKVRNFKLEQILLMSHGGAIHDTIAAVERYKPQI